jgi:hypothetical protein
MISKKFKSGTFKAALGDAIYICKVSDATIVVGKCPRNFSIPCFDTGCV